MGKREKKMNEARFDMLLEHISLGETLRQWARDKKMGYVTVYLYINECETRIKRFARAREMGHDFIAEEILAIADDGANDWMDKYDKYGELAGYQLNGEHVQRSKLRIDARLKLLAKWNPKKYGDKLDLKADITGEITQVTREIIKPK